MIIDSHCHIDFEAFDTNRDQVIQRARQLGIRHIIVPAVTAATFYRVKQTCEQYAECHPAYGLHPYFINEHKHQHLDLLEQWLELENCIGVGECGLDFYLNDLDKNKQMEFFEAQLTLADKYKLPVIIHSRKATEQVIQTLRKFPELRGMIHSYSGSYEQAIQLIDMGYYLSFGGAITYDRAKRLHSMIERLPLEHLLIETDAPDQPGQGHHGEVNEPCFIDEVINKLAVLCHTSSEKIISTTSATAHRLFSLSDQL